MQFCEAELRVNKSKLVHSPEDLQIIDFASAAGGRRWSHWRVSAHGRNHALPTVKYIAVVPGLCATSIPAWSPNLRASS